MAFDNMNDNAANTLHQTATPSLEMLVPRVDQQLNLHLQQAQRFYDRRFRSPTVRYDLRGRSAGIAKFQAWEIRLNSDMLQAQPDRFISHVPGHELAHLITHAVYGRVQPHGKEWQHVMQAVMELAPDRTHQFDYTPARRERTVDYLCECTPPDHIHALGIRRHQKAVKKKYEYQCRRCKATLRLAPLQASLV